MPLITWKDKVRVRVGELTRAGQFDLWRAAQENGLIDEDKSENVIRWSRESDNLVAAVSTRMIEICDGDIWRQLTIGESYALLVDDEETVTLRFPMQAADFDALPMSLANPWILAAISENGGLHDALFFVSSLVTFTTETSVTLPANES